MQTEAWSRMFLKVQFLVDQSVPFGYFSGGLFGMVVKSDCPNTGTLAVWRKTVRHKLAFRDVGERTAQVEQPNLKLAKSCHQRGNSSFYWLRPPTLLFPSLQRHKVEVFMQQLHQRDYRQHRWGARVPAQERDKGQRLLWKRELRQLLKHRM
jgi:hypothetical protein